MSSRSSHSSRVKSSGSKSVYGVFVGTPTSYDQQTLKQDSKSPHIYLQFGSAGTTSGAQSGNQSSHQSGREETRQPGHEERREEGHHSEKHHHGHHHGHESHESHGRREGEGHESREHGQSHGGSTQSHSSSSGSSGSYEAAINVRSTDNVDQGALVAYIINNFQHPITQQLSSLQSGFHQAQSGNDATRLDFVRTTPRLFQWSAGQIVNDENTATGGSGDILTDLDPIINQAISQKSTVYVFGTSYGTGIDDVHMNQGNSGNYENSIYSDGALLINGGGQWQAVFLTFASQEIPTNDNGAPAQNAQQIETLVQGNSS